MTSDSPHSELLTQAAARQLLERAGQIDYESTSVDALRAAALEAGISGAAFEAALAEMRSKPTRQATAPSRSKTKRLLVGIGAVAVVVFGAAMLVVPNTVERARFSNELSVKCLPIEAAAEIARSILGQNGLVSMIPGSNVLRFQGSPEDMRRVRDAVQAAERTATSCTKPSPGR
jgi:type II secretory pathway component GspD/PulD (secretin)